MRLKVIGSNSEGNCYIFENDNEALILECGVNFKKIKEALEFDISKVVGCLISHSHGDHCKSVKDVVRSGIDIYTQKETSETFGITSHRINDIVPGRQFSLGGFKIIPFDLHHDVPIVGFLLNHVEMGNTVFITDTIYCSYVFPNLNNILIEANYSQDIIDDKLSDNRFLRNRVIQSHMSVETAIKTLKANDITKVNNIVLIHLSDRNSDAKVFKKRIEDATLKTVTIATAGLVLENFNIFPF